MKMPNYFPLLAVVASWWLASASVCAQTTIRVPADYPSIQAAINAASAVNSTTVLVSPGVYNEAVNFNGKPVLLISASGPAVTVINPPNYSLGVSFITHETTNSVLCGFTITNHIPIEIGSASPTIISNYIVGGGILIDVGSPIIANNWIWNCAAGINWEGSGNGVVEYNHIVVNGTGIYLSGPSPLIFDNNIEANNGDGIDLYGGSANIMQNLIDGNTANGILIGNSVPGQQIVNNTIVANGVNGGAGISGGGSTAVINNIIVGTPAMTISPFGVAPPGLIEFNDIYNSNGLEGNVSTNGNISVYPLFACGTGHDSNGLGDYHLLAGSPCIDAGTNGAVQLPGFDFDGNPRVLAGTTNGPAIVDMGASEFNLASPPEPCLYLYPSTNMVAVAAQGQNSATVHYPAPDATPVAVVTCVPASGSVFPAGTNVVVCTLVYGTNTLTASFTVTVLVPPYITNQTAITSVVAGNTATLSVGGISTLPMNYQWSFEGTEIVDATNSSLIVSNAQSINEGYYRVTLANDLGAATSGPILLRVLPSAALIVSEPKSITEPAGHQAVFSAGVVGSAPLLLQWFKNGALLAGANSTELVLPSVQEADAGTYQLLASNSLGTAVSTGAILTVQPARPWFIVQPSSTAGFPGTSVDFSCLATGSDDGLDPINYSWYFQSNIVAGQTGATLSLTSIVPANQGAYYVVATNAYGSATSIVVQLTVYQSPSFLNGLTNEVVDEGSNVVLTPNANGTPPLAYIWNFNTTVLTNTSAFLALTNITPSLAGYYSVTVTNQFGSISSTGKISVFLPASQVVAWGDDSGGQTNVPTNLDDAVALAGGDYHSVVLRHDGTLVAWGFDEDGQTDVPTNSLRFVTIAAGADHNLAIAEDGSVAAWGRDDFGQTDIPGSVSSALRVAAGDSHSLALLSSGIVVAWGDDTYGQTDLPSALSGYWVYWWNYYVPPIPAKAIAAGRNHNLALFYDGTVIGWGDNSFGQSTTPSNLSNVVAIAAGSLHSVALCSNGTVVVWGDNSFGQTNVPAGLSNVVAIAAGDFHTFALRSNGNIVAWGDNTFGQTAVPLTVTNAIALASGYYHGLALIPFTQVLQPHLTRNGLVLSWNGTGILQWSPSPTGPYTDVPYRGNSWTNANMSAPAKFFRVRH